VAFVGAIGARAAHVPIIYVLLTYRRTSPPGLENMGNPFWRAVEAAGEFLTPDRRSTIRFHNQEGSPQTGDAAGACPAAG